MAKSEKDTKAGQTELVAPGGGSTQAGPVDSDMEARQSALKADEERLARAKTAHEEAAANLKRQQEALAEREKAMEARAQELKSGAAYLDKREAELKQGLQAVAGTGNAPSTSAALAHAAEEPESDTVAVLNNSTSLIGAPDGTPLVPTRVTELARATWLRWFTPSGKPVPGVAGHFSSEGGTKRPDLQEVSLKNLSALPDEHALTVVQSASAKDEGLLKKFSETEQRESVKLALQKRLIDFRKG